MAIPYLVVGKLNPQDRTKPKKFYPKATCYSTISIKDICLDIEKSSGLAHAAVDSCVKGLIEAVIKYVELGHKITLDGFGTFGVSFTTVPGGEAEPNKVGSHDVLKKSLQFRPSTRLRDAINGLGVEPYDKKITDQDIRDATAQQGS